MKKKKKSKPIDSSPEKGIEKDQPRLDLIRSKVSGEFPEEPDNLIDSPDADFMALQLQNLIERHKIDQASKTYAKEKARKKKSKFDEIRRRIDDGFYDNPNQLADLAEKLIRRFGLE